MFEFYFDIAYADTDVSGIVYHARYVEIAERARTAWFLHMMEKGAPSFFDMSEGGWVIKSLKVDYKRPLILAQRVCIQSRVIELSTTSIAVEQNFVIGNDIYASITINVVYIDGETMRPKRIPEKWMPYFK